MGMAATYERTWRKRKAELTAESAALTAERGKLVIQQEQLDVRRSVLDAEQEEVNERMGRVRRRLDAADRNLFEVSRKLDPVEVFQNTVMEEIAASVPVSDVRRIIYLYAEDLDSTLRMYDIAGATVEALAEMRRKTCGWHTLMATPKALSQYAEKLQWTLDLTPARSSSCWSYSLVIVLFHDPAPGGSPPADCQHTIELLSRMENSKRPMHFRGRIDRAASSFELIETSHVDGPMRPDETSSKWTIPHLGSYRLAVSGGRDQDVKLA